MPLHPADRGLLVLGVARAEGVTHDERLTGGVEKTEHSLLHADVRLATRNDGAGVGGDAVEEAVFAAGVEELLMDQAILLDRYVGHGRPQALRALLGEQARDSEQLGRFDEEVRVPDGGFAVVDRRHQP